jgi:hypothetical protein
VGQIALWVGRDADLTLRSGDFATEEKLVDPTWLVGAVVGSGLYVFFGRLPARRLATMLRQRFAK